MLSVLQLRREFAGVVKRKEQKAMPEFTEH